MHLRHENGRQDRSPDRAALELGEALSESSTEVRPEPAAENERVGAERQESGFAVELMVDEQDLEVQVHALAANVV